MLIEKGNWIFYTHEQYSQFFKNCAWFTFDVANIQFEDDVVLGGIEFTFIILGLGFSIRYNHTETKASKYAADFIKNVREDKECGGSDES